MDQSSQRVSVWNKNSGVSNSLEYILKRALQMEEQTLVSGCLTSREAFNPLLASSTALNQPR